MPDPLMPDPLMPDPLRPDRQMAAPAWRMLIAALSVGAAGDLLLRGGTWRLGFALWIATVMGAAVLIGGRPSRERLLLLVGTVLAAFGLVWRDAEVLYAIDMLSVLCMGALLVWHGRGESLGRLTVLETLRACVLTVVNLLSGAPRVIQLAMTARGTTTAHAARTRAIVIGVVLALPPLAVVSALLASSDAVFDGVLESLVRLVAFDGLQHVAAFVLLTWLAAGWFRATLGDVVRTPLPEIVSPGLPFMSVAVGLFALTGLLALFLATQLRVLFGGASFLLATKGLTVAAYAREGFFQLVVAAGVVLGTLVVAEWLLAADDATGRRRYRITGAILIVQVFALLVSAATRIGLYVGEFGLSIDRVVAGAGIVFVGSVLAIFAATTLRGRTTRFAPVTLIATVAWVALVNILNLEAIVVRVNVARAATGREFDAKYHAALSADALPALIAGASHLSPTSCQALEGALRTIWAKRLPVGGRRLDWRTSSLPLIRAETWQAAGATVCARPETRP